MSNSLSLIEEGHGVSGMGKTNRFISSEATPTAPT